MIETAFFIIQLGLAFVFFWTGVLIFKDISGWADILRGSWIKGFLPFSPEATMRGVAVFDIVLGLWLLSGMYLWLAALLAALHLVSVLLVTGIMGPAYRDVGLAAMAVGLILYALPSSLL